jgi:hypothetical protein
MEGFGGPAQPSPTIAQCLCGYGWLDVKCHRCETKASIPLEAITRPRNTPIRKLEASLKCRSCRKGKYAPPVHMIRLTEQREITLYVWVHHDHVKDNSPEHDEFRALDKLLCWRLLRLLAHMVSVLHPMLDGPMPAYMAYLASGRDWDLSKQWRRSPRSMRNTGRERAPHEPTKACGCEGSPVFKQCESCFY